MNRLTSYLRRWGLWLRLRDSLAWSAWGLVAGLALALALALAARIWPLLTQRPLLLITAALALSATLGGMIAAWLRPRSRHRLARILDLRLGLAERLSTALEIDRRKLRAAPAMAAAQRADTLSAMSRVDIRAALPLQIPRRASLAALALALVLTASLLLPNPQEGVLAQRRALRQALEEQTEQLETLREEIEQSGALTPQERAALLEALEEAIAALQEGNITPEEAVAVLANTERALSALQDPDAATLRAGLERAAAEMSDSALTQEIADLLAQGDYAAAAAALAAFAGEKGQALTREEELELAEQLAQAAQALADSNPELAEQLAQAAQAIQQGDIAQARQLIRQAAGQLAGAGQRVERQQAVEGALNALQEGREQVAQAGGQPAAGGQLAGPGQQGGQGQGQTGGQQAGPGQQINPGHSEDSGTGAPYDSVYVPVRVGDEGIKLNIGRPGEDGLPTGDTPIPLPAGGLAGVPYQEVYAVYAGQAYAALESSYVPLGMRQYVRDYFSSLEP
jgi:hypothetical protein